MTSVLLATHNPAKKQRLRWLLEGLPLVLMTLEDIMEEPTVTETGASHKENAIIKAEAWSRTVEELAMASDGGAVIPVLEPAWNSLHTARFAGEGAPDAARVERLLELLRPYRGEERRIRWVEALAIARRGRLLSWWQVEGGSGYVAEGYDSHHVVPGFWVATVWYFPHLDKRYGELTEEELDQVNDHWSQLRERVRAFFHREYTSPPP